MARYMIESPHKPEECLKALDEELAKGKDVLEKMEFGCKAGDHTGYALIEATSESAALDAYVPNFIRNKARAVEVSTFTPEMIKSFHAKAA
jgi:hypothetical protein